MRRKSPIAKAAIITVSLLVLVFLIITIYANISVTRSTSSRLYDEPSEIPYSRVGLLLGTSPTTRQGYQNPYFYHRIDATAALYKSHKISKILISGDNSRKTYNEPEDMRQALLESGIPDSAIVLDYAGFSTYESLVRAQKVFGQRRLTIISQSWHNQRALYIASHIGIDAVAFNASDNVNRASKLKLTLRECLARTKMFFTLIFRPKPHFLGPAIEI